jgi:putative membrane protein
VDFLKKAAGADLAEIKIGEMAHDRSTVSDIRALGQAMANDHRKSADRLNGLLQRMGAAPVTEPGGDDQSEVDKLGGLPDDGFDGEFQRFTVDRHQQLIHDYTKEADKGHDAQVRAAAKEGLPVLKKHLEMAKLLHKPIPVVPHQPKWARETPPMGGKD